MRSQPDGGASVAAATTPETAGGTGVPAETGRPEAAQPMTVDSSSTARVDSAPGAPGSGLGTPSAAWEPEARRGPHAAAPVDSIIVGERDREDLGDVEALAASIRAVGLLHPIVVTRDRRLIAGGRRLAAVRALGWTEVAVTVVDLDSVGDALRAEADENTQRKPLTPYEAARARERRARVLAEDAKRRQDEGRDRAHASRRGEEVGSPKLGEPTGDRETRKARETAKVAAIGTGYSGSTLDKVDRIRDVAERGVIPIGKGSQRREVPAPEPVREVAQRELSGVKKTGAAVDRASRAVAEAIERHLPPDPDEPHRQWRAAFLKALSHGRQVMQFDIDAVAERADDECADELRRLADDLASYARRVRERRSKADNVRKLRVV